jgi:hypothetical protein
MKNRVSGARKSLRPLESASIKRVNA